MHLRLRGRAPARPWLALFAGLLLAVTSVAGASAQPSTKATGPTLDLPEALARASAADPGGAGWDARFAAAEANVRQAGVKPNPLLGLEMENFAGSGAYSLLDRTETTLSYQQTLERGGKREARVGLARASAEVTRRRRDIRRLDLLRDVQAAYAEALAAEADLLIAEARLVAAQSAQSDVTRRVRAARDPLFAGSRAEATTAQAEIERDQARVAARNARDVVSRYWGGSADFALSLEAFFSVGPPSGDLAVAAADLALLEAERDVASSSVRLEQSRAVTDPTVRAGVRYFGDGSDVALVVGGPCRCDATTTTRARSNAPSRRGAPPRPTSRPSACSASVRSPGSRRVWPLRPMNRSGCAPR